jgi:hypothetical protein
VKFWQPRCYGSCRKSLATAFYMQCVGEGTRLLMRIVTKHVTVKVLYCVENVSNLGIDCFFTHHTWHNLGYDREMDRK